MSSRPDALAHAARTFDDGRFHQVLARRVALATESQVPERADDLRRYLDDELAPSLAALGFACERLHNPLPGGPPFLLASRREPDAAFTVLSYAHGDVVRGQERHWRDGLAPWTLRVDGERWYGRGTADNKGQHSINLLALEQVLQARVGRLGYDLLLLVEMGEEVGSPGLHELVRRQRERLRADLFIASDGPRVSAARPTLFLGSRGSLNFDLRVDLRPGAYHSGNWGGLLSNPGVRLAHAIASLVDARGRIRARTLVPPALPAAVRAALRPIRVGGQPGDPAVDPDWGEPGLTPTERVIGWNSVEVLAFKTGNPDAPLNAIPGQAVAHCQIRFVVGSDSGRFLEHLRAHLDAQGFDDVAVQASGEAMAATRLDPDNPWVDWALDSIGRSCGGPVDLLPNLGGSLPNDVFADLLGLPTLWVPHSYPACAQHAPDEHLLGPVAREALQVMAGLFWDLGDAPARATAAAQRLRSAAHQATPASNPG